MKSGKQLQDGNWLFTTHCEFGPQGDGKHGFGFGLGSGGAGAETNTGVQWEESFRSYKILTWNPKNFSMVNGDKENSETRIEYFCP